MHWLNYHHLRYFWVVAKEGTISRASQTLNLTQPTLSKQIKALEDSLGESLFMRKSSGLQLTEAGQLAYEYADDIFHLGNEFLECIKGVSSTRPKKLRVGISDVLPKLVSHRILEPLLSSDPPIRLNCEEDMTERLLAELSIQHLDLVLTDAPITASIKVKAFNHFLGDCGISFFAAESLRKQLRGSFPACLERMALLAPSEHTVMRRSLDQWFNTHKITPYIVAEFHDSALLKVFGREGAGVFAAPSVIAKEVCREYGVRLIGQTDEIKESFYAITIERRLNHPIVMKAVNHARQIFLKD